MIETKCLDITLDGFTIGRIAGYPGTDSLFLFGTGGLEMIQIALSGSPLVVLGRLSLKDKVPLKQMDCAFFDSGVGWLVIADSVAERIFVFACEFGENKQVNLSLVKEVVLGPGTIIVAGVVLDDEYLLLDKGNSLIRSFNKDFVETYTVGSRMGYISEYADQQGTRLGFEFPEDMVVWADGTRVVVADSGNKRLVVLHRDRRQAEGRRSEARWVQEKIITLPEFPFKFLAWDTERDSLMVSDFDRSWMLVSLSHGFVCREEFSVAVDFYPAIYYYDGGSWQGGYCATENNGLVQMLVSDWSLDKSAETAGNWTVLLRLRLAQHGVEEARQLVVKHPELLREYMMAGPAGENYFKEQVLGLVDETFHGAMVANQGLVGEITALAHQFIIKYKSIPDSDDVEAAQIDKENIRHCMFLKLKQYRTNLYKITELNRMVRDNVEGSTLLNGWLSTRFERVKTGLLEQVACIENNLRDYNELEILQAIVEYWLLGEEEEVVFREWHFEYPKLFGKTFLLAILKDFYYQIGLLFLNHGKIEEYISFIDREITMYSDKVGIFNSFINQLVTLGKYDDVFRMLNKLPDRNKESVNYFLYRVYLRKGDKDRAFQHLKKELELYPHRMNLIPELIQLGKLSPEESQGFIDKILNTSGQSIDLYLNVAQAYLSIKNYSQAEFYVDLELELFPENKHALSLKIECFNRFHSDGSETDYFWKTWETFKVFLKRNAGENTAGTEPFIPFFRALNHVKLDVGGIKELLNLRETITIDSFKKELTVYLSFLSHFMQKNSQSEDIPAIEVYDTQVYLSNYATQSLARDYFLAQAKTLKTQGLFEEMFELIERILKYNPGDEQIFCFLDGLEKD